MFIVTRDGKKLTVDDSTLDYENDYIPSAEMVGAFVDGVNLKPIWLLNMYRPQDGMRASRYSRRPEVLEFVAEKIFDHEPTKEEIFYAMASFGLSRYDVAIVEKGYEMGLVGDD